MSQDETARFKMPHIRYLSEAQQKQIHQASLEILERVGVCLYDQEPVDLFRKAGARVAEGSRVHIPSALVEWALSVAPRRIVLCNRQGSPVMPLERNKVFFGPGSDCLYILDHRTGERRPATLQDVEQVIRVCDALPNIDFLMSACLPSDVAPERANHLQMRAMLLNSMKPILFVTNDFASCVDVIEASERVVGGAEALRCSPICGCYINVTAPLRHNAEALQKLLYLSGKGLPTTYTPMVLRGVNGPVTSAGAIALANAGELVGLVLVQLKREGAPVIHSGGFGDVFDMRTMTSVYAAPESYGGRAAIGAYYGLPTFGLGGASDAKIPDQQAAAEAAFSLLLDSLGGVNLVHDVGYLESGKCYSLEQLVICDDLIGYIRRFMQGIDVSEETLALDLIAELGPQGDFLRSEHTSKHYREDWYPNLFDRNNYDHWAAAGSKYLRERARERVNEILENHRPEPLPPEIQHRIDEVLSR